MSLKNTVNCAFSTVVLRPLVVFMWAAYMEFWRGLPVLRCVLPLVTDSPECYDSACPCSCCKVPLFLLTDTWASQHGNILELTSCVGTLLCFLKASEAEYQSTLPWPIIRRPGSGTRTLRHYPCASWCLPASQAWNCPWTSCHFVIVASCLWS